MGLGSAGAAELAALSAPDAGRYEPDPRGSLTARAAVAGYYAARGIAVDPAHLVLAAGTSEAYAHLFRMLADPGDCFLVPAPSYPLFEPLAALEAVTLRQYRLVRDGAWRLDIDSLRDGLDAGARAVIVVQPNHPTGSCLAPAELEQLEALCEAHGAAIVSDEVFSDFPWPPADAPLPSLLGPRRVPTFVLSGLSKVCGMPGMKLSWIAAQGPAAARDRALEALEWIADLFLSVGTPVQAALPRLLEARQVFQAKVRARLSSNLDAVRAFVSRRPEFELLPAAGGWVLVLRAPGVRAEEEWALELMRRDVVIHPGHFYDFERGVHLVLSLIVEPRVLAEGLARLEALAAEG